MIYQTITKVIQQWVLPPVFPDKEQTRAARWLNFLILILIVLIMLDSIAILVGILDQNQIIQILLINFVGLAVNVTAFILMRRGNVKIASFILLTVLYALMTYTNVSIFQTIRTPSIMTYFALIPLTGLLVGRKGMNRIALLCILTIVIIFSLEWIGLLTPQPNQRSLSDYLVVLFLAIGMNTILLNASIRRIEENADEIRQTADRLSAVNMELQTNRKQLEQARADLEYKVQQRTQELKESNEKLQKEVEERQRLLNALAISEANWRSLAEQAPDLITRINPDSTIAFINRAIGGYTSDKLIDAPVTVIHQQPEHQAILRESIKTVFQTGGQVNYEIEEKYEEHRTWHINRVGPIQQDGKVVALILISTDITEQKQAEAAMFQMQKLESLGVLAGGVAHDFNNLLSVMLMQLSLGQTKLPAEHPVSQHIQRAMKAAERATEVTRQMLNYAGRTQAATKLLDLNDLIMDNIHLFSASIPKNVALTSELSDAVPLLKGDKGQIQQLIMNLIINGADAIGPHSGAIRVVTKSSYLNMEETTQVRWVGEPPTGGRYVRLEVHDTGCGMDTKTLAKIFDPFFTTKFTGRGLGLASVIGIVRSHRGALHVTSTVGKGTTFTILFPEATEALLVNDPTAVSSVSGAGELVLIIDDEDMVREGMADILKTAAFRVLTAADGPTGLQLIREHREELQLILLDLAMPVMGGEETFHHILNIDAHIPILLVSGYSEANVMERFVNRGLAGFVQKPYTADSLLHQVQTHLSSAPKMQKQVKEI